MDKWRIMWIVWLSSLISAWGGGVLIVFMYNFLVFRLVRIHTLLEAMIFVPEIAVVPATLASVGGILWGAKKGWYVTIAEGRKMGAALGGLTAILVYAPFGYHLFLRHSRIEMLLWSFLLVIVIGVFVGAINGVLLSAVIKRMR